MAGLLGDPSDPFGRDFGIGDKPVLQVDPMAAALQAQGPGGILGGMRDIPKTLYHGTRSTKEIQSSGALRPSNSGEFGPGVYLAPDMGTARFFAENVARGPDSPAILSVGHSLKNPFFTTKQDWLGMLGANVTPRQMQAKLKSQGYDGIVAAGLGGGGTQVVVFDPGALTLGK